MKPTRSEFLAQPQKAITLIGMSGCGKTHLARRLADAGWQHCSCDYLIGAQFMKDGVLGAEQTVSVDDLRAVSAFIGKLGDAMQGGLDLAEFNRRQRLYYDAECESVRLAVAAVEQAGHDIVVDSTGSFCEIEDDVLVDQLGRRTLVVYIRTEAEDEAQILERARHYPKPLFFPPQEFRDWRDLYMTENGLQDASEIAPDEFGRWVFPFLFAARLPKYERLAEVHGVTIASAVLHEGGDFASCVADYLE